MTLTCTRVSTLAKTLDDGFGLRAYEAATTLQAVAQHPDLRTQLALVDPTCAGTWRDFKPLYEEAQRRRGKPEAQAGTNIHTVVEHLVNNVPVEGLIPEDTLRDAHAVLTAIQGAGLAVAASEEFVYVPGLREPVAGTRDLLVVDGDGLHQVVDVKTTEALGRHTFRGVAWAIQVAVYAHGRPYPHPYTRDKWDRPQLDPALAEECGETRTVDIRSGWVIEVERGSGRFTAHRLNLHYGWEMAQLAGRVRAARKTSVFL